MSHFAHRYEQLQLELLSGRGLGVMSQEDEDRILERMDECWWKMTDDERTQAEHRIAEAEQIAGTDETFLIDVDIKFQSTEVPRSARR